jgi:hypothetical protein
MYFHFDFNAWAAPVTAFVFVFAARKLGGSLTGFLCGLPYLSAISLLALGAKFGDVGALTAARAALPTQIFFLLIATVVAAMKRGDSHADEGCKHVSPWIAASIASMFAFFVYIAASYLGLLQAGLLIGVPACTLCIVATLWITSGRTAAIACVRGFASGQATTIGFTAMLCLLIPHVGFAQAFAIGCAALVAAIVFQLRFRSEWRAARA